MTVVKRIACLANSRKSGGTCVAGRVLENGSVGPWLRPVSAREDEALNLLERRCTDGSDPRVLDVVDVPLLASRPTGHQVENWLIDSSNLWVKVGQLSSRDLPALSDPVSPLWEGAGASALGTDRVEERRAASLTKSLRFIEVKDLTLAVGHKWSGKPQVRGAFRYLGRNYNLAVTDPVYETPYATQPLGRYPVGPCYLTISLGEVYRGDAYKLVAAIVQPH